MMRLPNTGERTALKHMTIAKPALAHHSLQQTVTGASVSPVLNVNELGRLKTMQVSILPIARHQGIYASVVQKRPAVLTQM